jgi:hypothetical protein
MRDALGFGASKLFGVDLVDSHGTPVAHVSYNGRVWAGPMSESFERLRNNTAILLYENRAEKFSDLTGAGAPPPPPPGAPPANPADDPNNPYLDQMRRQQEEIERLRNEVKATEAARQSAFSAGFKAKLGAKKRGKADFDAAMDEMHSIMEKVGAAAEASEREERVRLGAQAVREAVRSGQHAERRGAASKLAEISGGVSPAAGQAVPPTAASIVRATWNKAQKEGFLRGAAAHGSFHTFLEAALERRAQSLQRRKASEKIALWEAELERIEAARRALLAEPDTGREIVRELLLGAEGQRGHGFPFPVCGRVARDYPPSQPSRAEW